MHGLLPRLASFLAFLSSTEATQYTYSAYAPGNHILDHLKVEAGGFAFNLGLAGPYTYCPITPSECPPGNETVFFNPGGLSEEVPGGQQLFITPAGLWSYTQAHSISVPTGSYYGNWNYTKGGRYAYPCCPKSDPRYNCNEGVGYYTYQSPDETVGGLFACPPPSYAAYGTYQIYGKTPQFNQTQCIPIKGIRAHLFNGPSPEAWQYT